MNLYEECVNELSKKYVKREDLVLDCGCGDGFHTSILKQCSDHVTGGVLIIVQIQNIKLILEKLKKMTMEIKMNLM